jgi:hypothetical protein
MQEMADAGSAFPRSAIGGRSGGSSLIKSIDEILCLAHAI